MPLRVERPDTAACADQKRPQFCVCQSRHWSAHSQTAKRLSVLLTKRGDKTIDSARNHLTIAGDTGGNRRASFDFPQPIFVGSCKYADTAVGSRQDAVARGYPIKGNRFAMHKRNHPAQSAKHRLIDAAEWENITARIHVRAPFVDA